MAQDLFNNTNGTLLPTHDANWLDANAAFTAAEFEINNNAINATTVSRSAGARYSTSTADFSEIVINPVSVADAIAYCGLRSDGVTRGYYAAISAVSAGRWTELRIFEDGSERAFAAIDVDSTSQATLQIKAIDNITTIDIEVRVNGILALSWTDTATLIPVGNPTAMVISSSTDKLQPSIEEWNDGVGIPVVDSLTTPLVDGSTGNTFNALNFGTTINAITIAILGFSISPTVSGSGTGPYSFDMQSIKDIVVDTAGVPFGSGTFTATDGTDTDIVPTSVTPAAGYDYVIVTEPVNTAEGSVFFGWTGVPQAGDQVLFPTANFTEVLSDGTLLTDQTEGQIDMFYFDQSDGNWKPFSVIISGAFTAILRRRREGY